MNQVTSLPGHVHLDADEPRGAKRAPSASVHDLMAVRARRLGREPLCTKQQLAEYYGYTTRWVELRLAEGMPSQKCGGQRRFRLSETDAWLAREAKGQR